MACEPLAAERADVLAVECDLSAIRIIEARQDFQERRLARTVWTDDSRAFPRGKRDGQILQDGVPCDGHLQILGSKFHRIKAPFSRGTGRTAREYRHDDADRQLHGRKGHARKCIAIHDDRGAQHRRRRQQIPVI